MKIRFLIWIVLLFPMFVYAQTAQTIDFPDIPVMGYGDATYTLNATSSSGLPITYVSSNTSVASVSGNTITLKVASGYAFISAFQNGNGSYLAATPVPQLLVITPKSTLTVSADNKSLNAGAATPTLTYTISGYKKGETSTVVSGTPSLVSPGSNLSAGTYPIVINKGNLAATNYEFMLVDGILTVNGATPVNTTDNNQNIKFYPNPATNFVCLENISGGVVSVTNISNQLIYQEKVNSSKIGIDITSFPSGLYFVTVETTERILQTIKFIKK